MNELKDKTRAPKRECSYTCLEQLWQWVNGKQGLRNGSVRIRVGNSCGNRLMGNKGSKTGVFLKRIINIEYHSGKDENVELAMTSVPCV